MRNGINYDVGTFTRGGVTSSRNEFDRDIVHREIDIIKDDLKCDSIRISGKDIGRLTLAAEHALQLGLEVWFSPAYIDADEKETLAYVAECALAAEKLRSVSDNIVLVVGCELTFFMKGLVDGDTAFERMGTFMKPWSLLKSTIKKGSFNRRLNSFLSMAVSEVKKNFHGRISYASGAWEKVDWTPFDLVAVDYYRDAHNKTTFREKLAGYAEHGKPVVITEFGCCTYRGAEDKGGYGWAIVDWKKTPPQLNGQYVRDEGIQAAYIKELLDIFETAHVRTAFVFTFISPKYTYSEDPRYDLDMASYSIVRTYSDRKGTAYEDMPWEPKKAFHVLAEHNKKN